MNLKIIIILTLNKQNANMNRVSSRKLSQN
jgi:hypothetical protein